MCRTAGAGPLTAAELPGSLALGSGLVISHNLHLPPNKPRRGSTGAHWAHPPHCAVWLGFHNGVCLLDFNWTKIMNKSGVRIKNPGIWPFLSDQIWPPWTPALPWQRLDGVESQLNALAGAWASSLSWHPGQQDNSWPSSVIGFVLLLSLQQRKAYVFTHVYIKSEGTGAILGGLCVERERERERALLWQSER